MARLGFYFDLRMCIGCRTCQVACKDKNRLGVGTFFRRVQSFETGVYPTATIYHFTSSCNHCENPKCVAGCPTGAMYKAEDGTVQHNDDLCIGCCYCTWNCPYSVPQYMEEKHVVGKCDSCRDLRDVGENPVCVDSCPMRAIKFGNLEDLKAEYGPDLVSELPILERASVTNPSLLVNPKNCANEEKFEEVDI